MMLKRALSHFSVFLIVLLLFSSCDHYPKDSFNTLNEVENASLLVGYSENPPWVISSAQGPDGIEVRIVEAFAESLNAEIEWVQLNEQSLLQELEHRNLHLVISGLTNSSPWSKKIGTTRPYLEHNGRKHIIGVPPGENRFLHELEKLLNKNKPEIKQLFNDYISQR